MVLRARNLGEDPPSEGFLPRVHQVMTGAAGTGHHLSLRVCHGMGWLRLPHNMAAASWVRAPQPSWKTKADGSYVPLCVCHLPSTSSEVFSGRNFLVSLSLPRVHTGLDQGREVLVCVEGYLSGLKRACGDGGLDLP